MTAYQVDVGVQVIGIADAPELPGVEIIDNVLEADRSIAQLQAEKFIQLADLGWKLYHLGRGHYLWISSLGNQYYTEPQRLNQPEPPAQPPTAVTNPPVTGHECRPNAAPASAWQVLPRTSRV